MRTFILGDIHGCSRPLTKLLDILAPDPKTDRVILLGDLFDRGPDSWEVLQIVRSLASSFEDRFVLLRGNHEDYLLQEKLTFSERMIWERVGRQATVRSFKQHGEKMEDCVPWIREHAVLSCRGDSFYCVHAGMKVDPPEANDSWTLIHDHGIVPKNRYSGPLTIVGHIALQVPTWFAGDGETSVKLPYDEWQTLPDHGIICIDAGCGKGGRLVGMQIENGRFILREVDGQDE